MQRCKQSFAVHCYVSNSRLNRLLFRTHWYHTTAVLCIVGRNPVLGLVLLQSPQAKAVNLKIDTSFRTPCMEFLSIILRSFHVKTVSEWKRLPMCMTTYSNTNIPPVVSKNKIFMIRLMKAVKLRYLFISYGAAATNFRTCERTDLYTNEGKSKSEERKGCRRKWAWPNLSYCARICL